VFTLIRRGQPPGGPPDGPAAAKVPAPLQVPPADSAAAMVPVTGSYAGGGQSGADACCWEDSDWDLAGSLTAREIAALAAMDRAGDPADNADDWDTGDAAPTALGSLPAGPWLQGDEPDWPSDDEPVAALPGLTPRHLGTSGGFDAGGVADRVPPGPVLAGLAADKWAAGLSHASDDELAGLMIAWRRVASWAAAGELAAVAELGRRREAQVAAGADPHLAEHVSDEVAMALTLTSWAAGKLVDRAQGLARLPKTMAALATGAIDVPKALVILGELSGLGDVHASRVEAAVISRAAQWTTGELRRAARRQAIAADPGAARKQKEQAEKLARVERWAEDAGTAALAGRDLPPAGVLAADAYLTAWAKRLKAAGLGGNLDQLRAQVYLALLNGQHAESLLLTDASNPGSPIGARNPGSPASARNPGSPASARNPGKRPAAAEAEHANAEHAGAGTCSGSPPSCGPLGSKAGCGEEARGSSPAAHKPSDPAGPPPAPRPGRAPCPADPAGPPPAPQPGRVPCPADPAGPPPAPRPGRAPCPADPPLRGSVNLVLPLSTWLGWSLSPGEVAGFGPLDAADSRALAAVLARDRTTNWCVTVTGSDDRALAHGCAKAGPGPPPTEPTGRTEGPVPRPPPRVCEWLDDVSLAWLETGECSHQRESRGYRPSRVLNHLIQIRQGTCTAPGCRRPATSCDFEHTIPYHQGGRSCECNGGPLCKR
jgi:hypothetical protein